MSNFIIDYLNAYNELLHREHVKIELDRVLNHAQHNLHMEGGTLAVVYSITSNVIWRVTR